MSTGDDTARWDAFLESLGDRVRRGELTEAQVNRLLATWKHAREAVPDLRYPAITIKEVRILHVGWNYIDLAERSLTVDITYNGYVDWFYCDRSSNDIRGTLGGFEAELPAEFFQLLTYFVQ